MKKLLFFALLPGIALAILDTNSYHVNNWLLPVCNNGLWTGDIMPDSALGDTWPPPVRSCHVFAAGVWLGAIAQGETLVTVACGPNAEASEFTPVLCRYWREGTTDPRDRIYVWPGDWPAPPDRFPMAPAVPRSEMDFWCCFGDSDPSRHSAPGRPLGADMLLSLYGFSDSIARDIVFFKYVVANNNDYALSQLYAGIWMDADIGSPDDDYTGLILNRRFGVVPDTFTVTNTGFIYDCDPIRIHEGHRTGAANAAVALCLLSSPAGLGLSAFKRFTIDVDPTTDPQRYQMMAGYDYRTGEHLPYDSIDLSPADQKFLLGVGPLDISPYSDDTFWFALIGSPFGISGKGALRPDTSELALRCWWAEQIFRQRLLDVTETITKPLASPSLMVRPNPARGTAAINYALPRAGNVTLRLYDATGQLRRTLVTGYRPAGNASSTLSVSDLSRGVYLLELNAGMIAVTTKLVVE